MTNFSAIAKLLSLLRMNSKHQIGGLTIETLLLIAEEPRTLNELTQLTGAHNGSISKAIRSIAPYWDSKEESVRTPKLHLLTRKKRKPPLNGYTIHLSKGGRQLLKEAGLSH